MFGKPVDNAQNLLPQLRSKDGFGEMTMDIREKLIEILREPIFPHEMVDPIEAVADYLLDSGVTVRECGSWKYYHKQNKAVCTNCSFERDLDANFGKAITCPNCGTTMDGDG